MALINAETKLCDVILHEPSVIPVINRFGIILGVGDKSIRTVCEEKNLDCEFFVTILNTFINEDYFPENRLKSFCATQIVDYLTQTNAYYEQFQIPNIERHFNFLINQSDSENNNLELKSLFVIHLKGEYDLNLCHGVIFAIYSLEKDIKQHNRIRNRILRPIADGMLEACRNQSFK